MMDYGGELLIARRASPGAARSARPLFLLALIKNSRARLCQRERVCGVQETLAASILHTPLPCAARRVELKLNPPSALFPPLQLRRARYIRSPAAAYSENLIQPSVLRDARFNKTSCTIAGNACVQPPHGSHLDEEARCN